MRSYASRTLRLKTSWWREAAAWQQGHVGGEYFKVKKYFMFHKNLWGRKESRMTDRKAVILFSSEKANWVTKCRKEVKSSSGKPKEDGGSRNLTQRFSSGVPGHSPVQTRRAKHRRKRTSGQRGQKDTHSALYLPSQICCFYLYTPLAFCLANGFRRTDLHFKTLEKNLITNEKMNISKSEKCVWGGIERP